MKRFILAVGMVLMLASTALAAPCTVDSLASYLLLPSGCTIGTSEVSAFTESTPVGATPISPGVITVTPLVDPGQPGLQFDVNAMASFGEILQILIGYTITTVLGRNFTGNSLSMAGATATGDAVVTVIEDKCLDGSFNPSEPTGCTGMADNLLVFQTELDAETAAALSFAAVASIDVFVDIAVDGGLTGSAALASVTTRFREAQVQPIPEPTSLGLLVLGLGSLVLLRRCCRRL